jgi:16S rRNA (cytosine967-C5)-methyltransferase
MQEQPRKILGKPAIKPARTVAAAPEAQPPAPLLELKPDSLAFSLSGAAQAVAYVLEGMALPQALAKVFTNQCIAASAWCDTGYFLPDDASGRAR